MTASAKPKAAQPLLLITSFPGDGHSGPLLRIAAGLANRGWDIACLFADMYETKVRSLGFEYFEAVNPFTPETFAWIQTLQDIPLGPERYGVALAGVFCGGLPARAQRLQETLELLRAREPGRQIIVAEDGANMSTIPWRYGAPLPKGFDEFPRTLALSPYPLIKESVDAAPSPLGLPPDSTPSGKLRNAALNKLVNEGPFRTMREKRDEGLRALGCTSLPDKSTTDSWFTDFDRVIQLCSPSLEYDLSDRPETVIFAGCLPLQPLAKDLSYPSWWTSEVVERGADDRKRIVFVTQGTVNGNTEELILPTINALSDREDILLIVVLGARGATLSAALPPNTRVIDYFPYDAVLAHADVFVSNAGYGGFTHAVINGVPAVFAGQTEEKPEVAQRAETAGFAVNLRTQTPTAEQIRGAVDEVLRDGRYKKRAVELRTENQGLDSIGVIEEEIVKLIK